MLDAGNTHREMRPARFGLATSASAGHADNRFIWLLVRRWKKLPDGGNLDPTDLALVIKNLKSAVGRARTRGAMQRDNAARDLWHRAYDELSEGDPGSRAPCSPEAKLRSPCSRSSTPSPTAPHASASPT